MNRLRNAFIPLCQILILASGTGGFKSKEEALEELERMYPKEAEVDYSGGQDEFTSIAKFVKLVLKKKNKTVYIICGSKAHIDAAEVLRAYLLRGRGFSSDYAGGNQSGVVVTQDTEFSMEALRNAKAFILGGPQNNYFIERMAERNKISLSNNKAQFRLFEKPNCVAIACSVDKMFIELVRVFLRSHADFDENCYSYFFVN
jgi:hypothetical protein